MLHILSLGAGVQSSAMALMAAKGELEPMPDCAIFADTGAEPWHVYDQVDEIQEEVPFPVYTVMHEEGLEKNIKDSLKGKRMASPPFFTTSGSGGGMLRRQCTLEFKINPIQKKIRSLMGLKKGQRGPKEVSVMLWMGISRDEAHRMKPSRINWIQNIFPLIDKGMHRYDCLEWMESAGYQKPKKSACYFCPYHDDKTWMDMKETDPDSWHMAIEMDTLIRDGLGRTKENLYLHRSREPLAETDLDPNKNQFDMFGNECEGLCGV